KKSPTGKTKKTLKKKQCQEPNPSITLGEELNLTIALIAIILGHISKKCLNKPNTTEEMKNYWKQEELEKQPPVSPRIKEG
ncbi:13626_t:CDS:2, partial [Racocetra persica]